MIYLLYGQPASGKTSLGVLLAEHIDTPFIIDGDEFRGMFKNEDYGFSGRRKNIRAANAVATYLNKKGKDGNWKAIYVDVDDGWKSHPINKETHVVICLVNPYEQFRDELKEDNEGEVLEVLLKSDRELRKEYHVEDFEEGNPEYTINTDGETQKTWESLKELLNV
jgi:adenylylsulfate kinase-like enzyme